jgi:hypothetical protein
MTTAICKQNFSSKQYVYNSKVWYNRVRNLHHVVQWDFAYNWLGGEESVSILWNLKIYYYVNLITIGWYCQKHYSGCTFLFVLIYSSVNHSIDVKSHLLVLNVLNSKYLYSFRNTYWVSAYVLSRYPYIMGLFELKPYFNEFFLNYQVINHILLYKTDLLLLFYILLCLVKFRKKQHLCLVDGEMDCWETSYFSCGDQ